MRPAKARSVENFSSEWVREAARAAVLDAVLSDIPVAEEKVDVRVKPDFDTACWSYLPPHRIYVGDRIPARARTGLSDEEMKRYVANYVNHEFAHALWTERNLKRVQQELRRYGPFGLFNLFEDARIEALYRKTYEWQFNWTDYEDLQVNAGEPTSLLFAFVQCEGDKKLVLELAKKADGVLVDEVETFYRRAVKARSSRALYPLVKEWVERFGRPPESCGGLENLAQSAALQSNPDALSAFEQDTVPVNGAPGSGERGARNSVNVTETAGNADLLGTTRYAVDPARARRLADRLERLFTVETRMASTSVPGKRISIRNFVAGKPFYRRRELRGRQRREVLLVIDCSGSMSGYHIEEGRALVAALSNLASRGIVSGHVVLSVVHSGRAMWQRFKLPMSMKDISHIDADGMAEGLEFALQENLDVARNADYVFVYTDAQICDAPINKRFLHSRGIHTWGLYAGPNDPDVLMQLTRFFDKATLRATAEQLVEAMLVNG